MDIQYTVKYKPSGLFQRWRKHKNVIGDGIEKELGLKFLKLADGTMVFYHLSYETVFSPEREGSVIKQMSKQAGQPVQEA